MNKVPLVVQLCVVVLMLTACQKATTTTTTTTTDTATTSAQKEEEPEVDSKPVKVETQQVRISASSAELTIPGLVAPLPDHSVKVSPAISGKLVSVSVIPGQLVARSSILGQLDSQHLRDQIEQAEATIKTAEVGVRQAKDSLDIAQDNLDRQQKLFKAEVVSQKDILLAENQIKTANSQVEAAQSQVKAALAAKKVLDSEVQYCHVKAPISGIVANRYLNVGDSTDPNTPIVQIVDLSVVNINAALPADSSESIHLHQSAQITLASNKNASYTATVSFVSPQVDAASNTIRIQLQCKNTDGELRDGQNVSVRIASNAKHSSVILPRDAIVPDPENPQNNMVYLVQNGKAKRVPVKLGATENDKIEVVAGLENGQVVIVKDAYGLPDGAAVENSAVEQN